MRFSSLLALTLFLSIPLAQANYDAKPLTTTKGGTGSASQTANIAVTTDGSGHLVSSGTTTATELGYVHGVTSSIQTQFAASSASLKALSWRPWVRIFDSTNTTLPTGTSYTEDGVTGANGDRVLFTALFSTDNRVYVLGGVGTSITWTLATDGQSGTGAPQEGDFLAVTEGTANKQTLWQYNGTVFAEAGGSSSGANTTLSNLTSPTAVNQDLLPATNAGENLGSPSLEWSQLYVSLIVDGSNNKSVDPGNRILYGSDGSTVIADWNSATAFTSHVNILPSSDAALSIGSPALRYALAVAQAVAVDQIQLGSASATDSINVSGTTVLPDADNTISLGSSSQAWSEIFSHLLNLPGSSSGSVTLSSGATPTAHTVTIPPTVCSAGQYWADDGSGNYSCTTVGNITVVDGGDAAYSIAHGDGHVRTTTTLTAQRAYTLPACDASHIGERHEVKDTPAQTFNIVVTANGSDNIDGASTFTLSPGDSVSVICGAFSTNGTWDIE